MLLFFLPLDMKWRLTGEPGSISIWRLLYRLQELIESGFVLWSWKLLLSGKWKAVWKQDFPTVVPTINHLETLKGEKLSFSLLINSIKRLQPYILPSSVFSGGDVFGFLCKMLVWFGLFEQRLFLWFTQLHVHTWKLLSKTTDSPVGHCAAPL